MTANSVQFAHINLIAVDWRRLTQFYVQVFGCIPLPPERDLYGEWLDRATSIPGAHLRGVHLRLPGWGDAGPTLEIFQYDQELEKMPPATNRPGFGHIAFKVADVAAARQAVLAAGGADYGEMVDVEISGAGTIQFIYVADPEGNIIELQKWEN